MSLDRDLHFVNFDDNATESLDSKSASYLCPYLNVLVILLLLFGRNLNPGYASKNNFRPLPAIVNNRLYLRKKGRKCFNCILTEDKKTGADSNSRYSKAWAASRMNVANNLLGCPLFLLFTAQTEEFMFQSLWLIDQLYIELGIGLIFLLFFKE